MAPLMRQNLVPWSSISPSPSGSTVVSHMGPVHSWHSHSNQQLVSAHMASFSVHLPRASNFSPLLLASLRSSVSALICFDTPRPPASPKSLKESDIHLGLVALCSYLLWVQERYSFPPSPLCTHQSTGNRLPNSRQFLGKRRQFCDEQSGSIWLKCLKSPVHGWLNNPLHK